MPGTGMNAQIGVVNESTYGTPVTVTKFLEFNTEGIQVVRAQVESNGMRTDRLFRRLGSQIPYTTGAAGPLSFDVQSKGFGFWLVHMLGQVGTTGPTDSAYVHTGSIATVSGDSFTLQKGVPFTASAAAAQPFTFAGGKVKSWELACAKGEVLKCNLDLDFRSMATATALATASYPANMEPLTFLSGSVTIAGTTMDVTRWSVKGDNALSTDRYYIGGLSAGNIAKGEPTEQMREGSWEVECTFTDLVQQNRVVAASASAATATIVITCQGLGLIGASSLPKVVITITSAFFMGGTPTVGGPDVVMQTLSGSIQNDCQIAYTTADVTP